MSYRRKTPALGSALALALLFGFVAAPARAADWLVVDYGAILDRRELSHSSESVGTLLEQLEGRPLPPPGERPADRRIHALLDPLVEPYAFVLPDAVDSLEGLTDSPLVEIGSLWLPGERQPAWVELLRARRFVVESDGRGNLRVFVPAADDSGAQRAFEAAWPILRHVFAAEQARLGGGSPETTPLRVTVYAYRHEAARSRFLLDTEWYRIEIVETLGDGRRPPLDLAAVQRFLDQGLQLEGGRLDEEGTLQLFGSAVDPAPTILGRPVSLGDLAVAYRAVFHGGLAEPYMSLDRGLSPETALVNYGGRLRDTALGTVSLECDIRFKTFSLGIDVVTGADVRQRVRGRIPGFKTHLERFSDDPQSAGIQAQQTRLWFYPDAVDLTVSPQLDVLAMRRARMSAASERVVSATSSTAASDPPWTLATVGAINEQYEEFASVFPELGDLDQVVRLLSFFTWLKQAELAGRPVPDLDVLLTVELEQHYTPREYPQLLTFDALPEAGDDKPVVVFDRVAVGDALARLDPMGGAELPAGVRLARAVAALDPTVPREAEMIANIAEYDAENTDDSLLDLLAYRAERLRMHRIVLGSLGQERGRALADRQEAGESLRIFSVGIGGLDLGMNRAFNRAGGSSIRLASNWTGEGSGGRASTVTLAPAAARESAPRASWREASAVRPETVPPAHGGGGADAKRLRLITESGADSAGRNWILTVTGASDPEVRSRKVYLGEKRRAARIERQDGTRQFVYRFVRRDSSMVATPELPVPSSSPAGGEVLETPDGLVHVTVLPDPSASSMTTRVQLQVSNGGSPQRLEADFPRAVLQRLVMGREVDLSVQPMPLAPLPPALGAVEAVMFGLPPDEAIPPWGKASRTRPGEDEPVRLARSLNRWSALGPASEAAPPAVVGVDLLTSPGRWLAAPRPANRAVLLMPTGAFAGRRSAVRQSLASQWRAGPVVESLAQHIDASLVVMVSDEPPGLCAARLARLAGEPALNGKLLAAWCLEGEPRSDIAPLLLKRSGISAVGIASTEPLDLRQAVATLESWSRELAGQTNVSRRVETLPGPFVWYF